MDISDSAVLDALCIKEQGWDGQENGPSYKRYIEAVNIIAARASAVRLIAEEAEILKKAEEIKQRQQKT